MWGLLLVGTESLGCRTWAETLGKFTAPNWPDPYDFGCLCKHYMKCNFKVTFKTLRFQHCEKWLERVWRSNLQEFRGLTGSRDLAKRHPASLKAGESQDAATEWANIATASDTQRFSHPLPGRWGWKHQQQPCRSPKWSVLWETTYRDRNPWSASNLISSSQSSTAKAKGSGKIERCGGQKAERRIQTQDK